MARIRGQELNESFEEVCTGEDENEAVPGDFHDAMR